MPKRKVLAGVVHCSEVLHCSEVCSAPVLQGGGGGRERGELAGGKEGREGRENEERKNFRKVDGNTAGQNTVAKKPAKHKGGGAYHVPKPSKARMPVHYVVIPALLLGGMAVVVYVGEQWLLGPAVNTPVPLPPAVSEEWRQEDSYLTRLWGTYRYRGWGARLWGTYRYRGQGARLGGTYRYRE